MAPKLQLLTIFLLLSSLRVFVRGYSDIFPDGTYINRTDFPDDFVFGAMTWAVKHEAAATDDGKGTNIWDVFAVESVMVEDGSSPSVGGDQYYKYNDDIKFVTDMGMSAYRFSIAWSRIFPNGSGEVNEKGIAHYNALIDSLIEEGLDIWVTLYEQDLPYALEESYGGLLSPRIIDDFANYANTCFAAFGDRVKHWMTFDEANDFVPIAYASSSAPPGRCSECSAGNSWTEPYIVGHNVLLAHAAAAEIYKNEYQAEQGGEIGMAMWFKWYEPLDPSSGDDVAASQRATDFTLGWFFDVLMYGDYPKSMKTAVGSRLPNFTEAQSESLRKSVDYIGLNIVTAIYTTYTSSSSSATGYWADMNATIVGYRDGVAIGEGEHEYMVPWCMKNTLEYVKDRYDNPRVYITQIGWGIDTAPLASTLDDSERVSFYASYFNYLIAALKEGANVQGLFAWSLIDGFEFAEGLSVRFGLYYVDDEYNRYPRLSALWFKEILTGNETTQLVRNVHGGNKLV